MCRLSGSAHDSWYRPQPVSDYALAMELPGPISASQPSRVSAVLAIDKGKGEYIPTPKK